MRYAFFAAGPVHLLSFYELIKKKNINDYNIFIVLNKEENVNRQMILTCKYLGLRNYSVIKIYNQILLNVILNAPLLFKIYKYSQKTKFYIVISDFKNTFYHLLRILYDANFVITDEGLGTILAYFSYFRRGVFFPVKRLGRIRTFILKYFFSTLFRTLLYKKMTYFSFFKIHKNYINVNDNDFHFLKKKLKQKKKINNSIVYFSGTKLSERGVISLEDELELLRKIKLYWKNRGKDILYVAKRTTSEKKLELIKKKLSLKVKKFKLPIEIAISNDTQPIPYAICSHGSATNVTLSYLYNMRSFVFSLKLDKTKSHSEIFQSSAVRKKTQIINI